MIAPILRRLPTLDAKPIEAAPLDTAWPDPSYPPYDMAVDVIEQTLGLSAGLDADHLVSLSSGPTVRTPSGRVLRPALPDDAVMLHVRERHYRIRCADDTLEQAAAALRSFARDLMDAADRIEAEYADALDMARRRVERDRANACG